MAQLQGIDIDDQEPEDVADLHGARASQAGFGIGMGLGHTELVGES
jgi:hypothetical protein